MDKQEPVPGIYQHYKGDFYEVLGVAEDPTREGRFVVYRSLGIAEDITRETDKAVARTGNQGALSVCPVDRFTETVDGGIHAGGRRVPRFRLVNSRERAALPDR